MSRKTFQGTVVWALMAALVLGAGAAARAQVDEASDKGVVKIGHADGEQAQPKLPPPDEGQPTLGTPHQVQLPKYWIGLLGGAITADSPLRAQLDIPEKQGLIVASIVPNSPAAKAGLKQHDILLRANDKDLHEMQDLVELVLAEGPKKGQITLDVLRHNKRETVYMTPEERPANAQIPEPQGEGNGLGGAFGGGNEFNLPNELMQQFGGNLPMEFRNFGPGVIVGGNGNVVGGGAANLPNGVTVSINKQGDKPAHITVKRGNDTWEVTGDDPASLKQLPEDLRPFVEQMVHGGGMHVQMPRFQQGAPGVDGQFRERMDQMEKQLDALQKRFGGADNAPADKSNDQHDAKK